MNARDLLTIDVAAELRRLAEATLEGPWQVPAELVRRSVAAGARRIEVTLARDRLVVRDDGRPLPAECQRDLDVVLDSAQAAGERHRALVALEAHTSLLSIAALAPSRVRLTSGAAGGTTITLSGTLDAEAARAWLRAGARFAPCTVVVDGATLEQGFPSALAVAPLAAPLHGQLALTHADTAHLWLLAHGVVSSHLTLPDTPAFEAAVELSASVPSMTPAALRDAVEPHIRALVDQAVSLMLDALRGDGRRPEVRRGLRSRLLVAARRGWRRADIYGAPMMTVIQGPDGASHRDVSIDDLGKDRALPCLGPNDDPAEHLLPHGPVLVLDEDERGQLAPLLGLRFRPVPRRHLPRGWTARARAFGAWLRTALPRAAARLRHPRPGRPLPRTALAADEHAFIQALESALANQGVGATLTDGAGPPTRRTGQLLLPRRHPDVRAAIRAVARDAAYGYVAALAFASEEVPSPEAARAWRRSLSG